LSTIIEGESLMNDGYLIFIDLLCFPVWLSL
jgi:NhaP-type Na+/H+ or K+/H+ antiporter